LLAALTASPWGPAEWRLNLNIGREPGTYMPTEWGASGARLPLSFDVLVESQSVSHEEMDKERNFIGGSGKSDLLHVLEDPVYVGMNGEHVVPLQDSGGWKIATRRTGKPGDAGKLRFWLQVAGQDGQIVAQRNDATLAAGRLYFMANCWRKAEYEVGCNRIKPAQLAYDEAQRVVEQRLSHEFGDRRLDGANPVETALGTIDMALLVKQRDERLTELKQFERKLPCKSSSASKAGHWPGSTEQLIIAKGKVGVKRNSNSLFGDREDICIIGTWTASPLKLAKYYDN
jgi:hypothetical protein